MSDKGLIMRRYRGLPSDSPKVPSHTENVRPAGTTLLSLADSQRLIHELQVSKFELEMQNDELRRAWNEKQEAEGLLGKYSDHYDFAPVGYFTLDSTGRILTVNFTGADILGTTRSLLTNRNLDSFVSKDSRTTFHDFLCRVFTRNSKEACEVVFLRGKGPSIFVQVEAVATESGQECRAVVIDITERKRAEEAHARLAAIVTSSADAIISMDMKGIILDWNAQAKLLFGYCSEEAISKPMALIIPPELFAEEHCLLKRMVNGEKVEHIETVMLSKDGRRINASVTVSPIINAGRMVGVSKIIRDISERKQIEAYKEMGLAVLQILNDTPDLQDTLEQVLATLKVQTGVDAVGIRLQERDDFPYFTQNGFPKGFTLTENTLVERDEKGRVCRDKNGKVSLECACGLVISGKADLTSLLFTPGGSFWTNDSSQLLAIPLSEDPRTHPRNKCIRESYGSMALIPIRNNKKVLGLIQFNDQGKGRFSLETVGLLEGIATHIGSALMRKKAEVEKVKLENQLQHAQKMESVGRLAGGVAHDFNNMLGVIIGHANLALMDLDPAHPVNVNMEEIRKAAERSANLTRQLLAFARKQAIAPKVVDLNDSVASILVMLKRLIGEHIDLKWKPGTELWPIKVDPSQIDQILANLCVNARDAIADIGQVTIETRNLVIDQEYCANLADSLPGEYVILAVSDNGHGMDKETITHIFEPFFTTKGVGNGTGLGLSTVYGAARQNNGFLDVNSEPGMGTTLTVYFPRDAGQTLERPKAEAQAVVGGKETVLLVEDEPAILVVASKILKRLGYTVLAANSPDDAMLQSKEHIGEISLLLTDVVMPEMNGRDLAKKLLSLYPHLKRMFMSGYTSDIIAHQGVLDEGVHFIQKPFTAANLAVKVREVLDEVCISADDGGEVTTELCCNVKNRLMANHAGIQSPWPTSELTSVFPGLEVHQAVLELGAEEQGAASAEGLEPRDAVVEVSLREQSEEALQKVECAANIALQKMDDAAEMALVKLEKAANVRRYAVQPVKVPPHGNYEPTFVNNEGEKSSDLAMEMMSKEAHEAMKTLEEASVAAYRKVEEAAEVARRKVAELALEVPLGERKAPSGYRMDDPATMAGRKVTKAAEVARRVVKKAAEVALRSVRKSAEVMLYAQRREAEVQSRLELAEVRSLHEKAYAQRLIVSEETLRKRIAMDLHDDIAQVLTALGLNLSHLDHLMEDEPGDNLRSIVADSRMLTKEVSCSVRDLMVDLHPLQLDEFGLTAAITSHAKQFANRTGVDVAVSADSGLPKLKPEEETAFFRIVQEALNNVVKHAAATRVTISLARVGEFVRLTIADDGKGVVAQDHSPLPTGHGWGLRNMRERTELIGGSLRVNSALGQGTTIMVEIKWETIPDL